MTLPRTKARLTLAVLSGVALAALGEATAPALAAGQAAGSKASPGCLPAGNGYLRAKIRGAMNLDVNWRDAELECDGGPRPDGNGIRLSFAGPLQADGRRLRMVFGVTNAAEGDAGTALPTNLTVIFEGEKRLFATRGDDKCTVDKLQQERVGALGGDVRSYRVVASGFCTEPANDLAATARIVVSSFDFAGRVTFEPAAKDSGAPPASSPDASAKIPLSKGSR
jgi:hypothetical protein